MQRKYGTQKIAPSSLLGLQAILKQGDVIPHTQGLRKVRWARQGTGKQGGSRVIYFNRLSNGEIWLLIVYSKAKFDNLPLSVLQQLREELNNGR